MADTPEAIRKSIRTYLFVGGILFIGTIVTVMVATVPWLDVGHHGFDAMDAILGLAIAATKASLVAAIFMHLRFDSRLLTWVFVAGLLLAVAVYIAMVTTFRYWQA